MAETVLAPQERERLRREAAAVLAANDAGGWTTPSSGQYPHQWNWDTAFVALGWARLDWRRATMEIESLLRGQWRDGMVPHTVYDPAHLDSYFPGPDRWPNAGGRTRVTGLATSGISNPPLVASTAVELGRLQPDPGRRAGFYARIYPGLVDWLRWYARDRTLDGCPLPVMVHPWESGWDNSPRWDFLRGAGLRPRRPFQRTDRAHVSAEQRPTDAEYRAYLALAELLGESGYSLRRYREVSPFLIHDVLLDAVWYGAAVEPGHPVVRMPSSRFRWHYRQRTAERPVVTRRRPGRSLLRPLALQPEPEHRARDVPAWLFHAAGGAGSNPWPT